MDIFSYFLKVNTAIVIFYMVYRTCYCKDTFFNLRRYLLLSMFTVSILYPFLDFSHWFAEQQSLREVATTYIQYFPDITITPEITNTNTLSFTSFLLWGYLFVTSFFLVRLFIRILQIVWIRMHCSQINIEGTPVLRLKTKTPPYSFFHWIFINPDLHKPTELHEIITHELIHANQHHSCDILFAEILCAFCWPNPLAWKLKNEIHRNLEFIVDQQVIKTGINSQSYQYHLLRLAYHSSKAPIVNQFNVSPIKERIIMLNTKQSPKMKLTAYTLVLPLLLLFVIVNNTGAVINNLSAKTEFQSVVNKVSELIINETSYSNAENSLPQTGFEISGTIVNENDQNPIPGVNIIICGTSNGTISDTEGNFRLLIQEGDSLLLSHIGYKGVAFLVKNKINHIGTIQMKRKQEELGEIIVTGYGKNNDNHLPSAYNRSQQTINQDNEVFVIVEEMPEFPGGASALMQYIASSVKYPATAQQNGIQGRVICTFTVNADGSIIDAKIDKSIDPSLDSEALRIICAMPKWKPGKQRGKPVAVEYTVPINFRLQG